MNDSTSGALPEATLLHVTLLTQAQCGFCEQAQETLERLAREVPLTLTYVNLASVEGHQLALRYGVIFAPGVLLDGAFFSYGRLSERKLRRALVARLEARRLASSQ
jgi:thiol-disulfide isomerase/thioredoxin